MIEGLRSGRRFQYRSKDPGFVWQVDTWTSEEIKYLVVEAPANLPHHLGQLKVSPMYDLKRLFELSDGQGIVWIDEPIILSIPKNDGMWCKRCNEFYPMAVANDAGGFKCWSCRSHS